MVEDEETSTVEDAVSGGRAPGSVDDTSVGDAVVEEVLVSEVMVVVVLESVVEVLAAGWI